MIPSENWTHGSDGSTTEWAAESGLVGEWVTNDRWVMFVPRPSVVYASHYLGRDVSIKNNGDGTYLLLQGGNALRLYYSPRWASARFFDAQGYGYSDENTVPIAGDPVAAFFTPGQPYSIDDTPSAPVLAIPDNPLDPITSTNPVIPGGPLTPTYAPVPTPPVPVYTTPAPVGTPIGTVTPGGTGTHVGPAQPVTAPFPDVAGAKASESESGKLLLLAGAAALMLLN